MPDLGGLLGGLWAARSAAAARPVAPRPDLAGGATDLDDLLKGLGGNQRS